MINISIYAPKAIKDYYNLEAQLLKKSDCTVNFDWHYFEEETDPVFKNPDIIILHSWAPRDYVGASGSYSQLAKITEDDKNKAQIFGLAWNGSYDTKAHQSATKIFSYHDELIIEAIKKIAKQKKEMG